MAAYGVLNVKRLVYVGKSGYRVSVAVIQACVLVPIVVRSCRPS
jgi:hypothetical protein